MAEEADGITLLTLRDIGWENETQSLRGLSTEALVQAVVLCVAAIDPARKKYSESLPKNMSARVNACNELAAVIKELGYKGDIGYHQLMYPNDNDTRKLLSWLTQSVPKEADKQQTAADGDRLRARVADEVRRAQRLLWLPPPAPGPRAQRDAARVFALHAAGLQTPFVSVHAVQSRAKAKELEEHFRSSQPLLSAQPPRRVDVPPSVLERNCAQATEARERQEEWNSAGLESGLNPWQFKNRKRATVLKSMADCLRAAAHEADAQAALLLEAEAAAAGSGGGGDERREARRGKRFAKLVDYGQEETSVQLATPEQTEEELRQQRETAVAEAETQLGAARAAIEQTRADSDSLQTALRQWEAQLQAEQLRLAALEEEFGVKKKIFRELLPDADNNIRVLHEISQASAARLLELAREWEQHRAPVIEAYRALRQTRLSRKDEWRETLDAIRGLREQLRAVEDETQRRDERLQETLDAYRRMPRNINRAVYTVRILEIVRQVKKQKVDIEHILRDTRALQKDINASGDTLGRTFAIANELIFADAKKDAAAKQAFRELVAIHDKFKELSEKVKESGDARNGVLDLEEKLQQINIRAGTLEVERIEEDLRNIRAENAALAAQLAAARA